MLFYQVRDNRSATKTGFLILRDRDPFSIVVMEDDVSSLPEFIHPLSVLPLKPKEGLNGAPGICDVPVIGMDFTPTILNMVNGGAAPAPCDGLDISSLFKNPASSLTRNTLYWHYPHYSDQGGTPSGAIREGDWKLIEFFEDNHVELYNPKLDPGERYDFASSFSDKALYLGRKLQSWRESVNAQMPTPNPNFNPSEAHIGFGASGCSWRPIPGCSED